MPQEKGNRHTIGQHTSQKIKDRAPRTPGAPER